MLLGVTDYIVYNGDNHRELKNCSTQQRSTASLRVYVWVFLAWSYFMDDFFEK